MLTFLTSLDGINIKLTCKMNRRLAEAKNSSSDIGKSQIEKQEYIYDFSIL
jgi:hypothetical protein